MVDFNKSSKVNLFSNDGTLKFLPRRVHTKQLRRPIEDWESFLYTICYIQFVELGWFFGSEFDGMDIEEAMIEYGLKKQRTNVTVCTRNRIFCLKIGGELNEFFLLN